MESEIVKSALQTGQDVANYGFTGAISILCLAVIFLYKQISLMNQKIQDLIASYAKDLRDLACSLQGTIDNNTKNFEDCRKALEEFKEIVVSKNKK